MLLPTDLIFKPLQRSAYRTTWQAMQRFTDTRMATTPDEIWFIEHPPVFTLGQNGRREHILNAGQIPVIQTDRGGHVTYHGPGQLLVYVLLDLRRRALNVRALVELLELSIIELLARYNIPAQAQRTAPGVYVQAAKICSIGLRIRRSCSYHGLALNVAMDLEPFDRINPCGFSTLVMTQLAALGAPFTLARVVQDLTVILTSKLQGKLI